MIARLNCAAGDFCLRCWPPDAMPKQRLLGLHNLLKHVHDRGVVAVSVPVTANDGSTLVFLHNRVWQLEPWMPGIADFHRNPSEIRLQTAMRCLSAWHHAAASYNAASVEATWFSSWSGAPSPAVHERLERIDYLLSQRCLLYAAKLRRSSHSEFQRIGLRILELFQRAAPHVTGQLKATAQLEFALQPCLRDIWHDHVHFVGSEVVGFVDFGAIRIDNVAGDVARLVGRLAGKDDRRWQVGLAAYAGKRPLSEEEARLVTTFDESGVLLAGVNWLDWVYCQRRTFEHHAAILSRMDTILDRLTHLAARK